MKPTDLKVAVGCLWCACIYAMALKSRLTEYDGDANLSGGFIGACRRYMRFKAFERLDVPALVAFLPTLVIFSTALFFVGGVLYASQVNQIMMVILATTGVIFRIAYFLLFISPAVTSLHRLR